MAIRFHLRAACVSAAGVALLAVPAEGRGQQLSLDVLLDDLAGVPAGIVADAQPVADRIFAALQVRITWFDVTTALRHQRSLDSAAAQRAFVTSLYVVRLASQSSAGRVIPSERTLGLAVVGTRIGVIPYPRVQELSRSGNVPLPLVLGHVMAHELGHLLLQRATHSAAGLMRATLDLQLAQQGRLVFTREEASAIRTTIARQMLRRGTNDDRVPRRID